MKKVMTTWIVSVLALVGLFAWMGRDVGNDHSSFGQGNAQISSDYELVTADNKIVRGSDFVGKYQLVYFGFTHCPDVCPTSLLLMTNVINQLGDQGKMIQPIFITVDPERDTPDIAAQYAHNFGSGVLGLSGSAAQIKQAADGFKVYYNKVEDVGSALGYVVDHSSFIYLMGPDGKYVAHFDSKIPEAELKKELSHYVR